jgi:hypothetical protein
MTLNLRVCERQRPMGSPLGHNKSNVMTLVADDTSRAVRRISCQPSTI